MFGYVTANVKDLNPEELKTYRGLYCGLCRTLKEYMIFVERIRLYTKTMELDAAAERAVDECIREGVLSNFLRKNRGEAIEMSIFEYDEERELKLIRRAEYEEGLKVGRENG